MSSSQNSASVLVQHSPPPPHTFTSPYNLEQEPQHLIQPPIVPEPLPYEPVRSNSPQPETEQPSSTPEMPDTPMVDAPAPAPTESEPQPLSETEQDQVPVAGEEPQPSAEDDVAPEPAAVPSEPQSTVVAEVPSQDIEILPPPPPDPRKGPPDWVLYEEDVSKPTPEEEEELKLRESRGTELSALDVPSVEKRIYSDVDDPDMRPVKKLRLSWIIKGVRGTQDKPNYARVMISPPALVDGTYWQIKFYPRGNRASSYSAYIRCSKRPPDTEREIRGTSFSVFEGPPDANFGPGAVPSQTLRVEPAASKIERSSSTSSATSSASQKQDSPATPEAVNPDESDSQNEQVHEAQIAQATEEDWRVSAQLGVVMYNPEEPRTCAYTTSEHQFSRHTDDWGWSNVVGPWKTTHMRQHLQRAPLLQNDTIAIDAYIRIFDDPTKALWWRSSDGEPHWDSKTLAGYFPMGTPPLYHSPAVAGMTAWLLLAPFRKVLQSIDSGAWRRDSQVRPKPFIAQLQMILFLMVNMRKERESYVDLYPAIQALSELGEDFTDVKTFWEVFRRSIELELEGDNQALKELSAIFDGPNGPMAVPPLSVENVLDIQQTLGRSLRETKFRGTLPNFLPLMLARDKFDKTTREWKLLHDRVILNDELDLSEFVGDAEHAKYTLYGFMVHAGARNSGKFYAVLRPNGPNTMWLAFEDGDGNQVFSYSRKRLQTFEGLEGQALKDFNSTRSTAYMAMYIKTSRLGDYLPGDLEPYKLPNWLSYYLTSPLREAYDIFAEEASLAQSDEVQVEVYSDEGVIGREGLLDMYNIKQQSQHKGLFHILTLPRKSTYQDLRRQLARMLELETPEAIRLFLMGYGGIGNYATAQLVGVNLKDPVDEKSTAGAPICLWMSVLKEKEDLEVFGEPDKPDVEAMVQRAESRSDTSVSESDVNSTEELIAAPDAEQASVQAAVIADLARTSSGDPQPATVTLEINDQDTTMQLDVTTPIAEEPFSTDVPHGHLVDAAAHEDLVAQNASRSATSALSAAEEAVITAVIAGDAGVVDIGMESGSETTDPLGSQSSESSSQSSSPPPEREERPVDNVYGFIQVFDLEKQMFQVEGTFFARTDDKVREFLQKRLGYSVEKNFAAWRRQSTVDGTILGADETFRDAGFTNGSDIVVYEPASEAQIKKLEKDGKFTHPHELSKYLRAVDRRHPIQSKTTAEPIELADFGTDYYKGPLVNGRCHGAHCLRISSAGNTYEGPLVCNVKSGKGGKMTYCNRDTYEGEWHLDERHGQGTFVEARTGNKYVGGFENGKRWGMGTTYWQVADEQADLCQICYGNEIDALFFDCGHVCACVECAKQCELCPICRKAVKQVVKMFRS
ncbi:hypothetical protein G647_00955 [Cladophialophora carrionii CBS 160.54]|uniref:RING-type domain-containing protein n=1 Tax=Cladophialophora carrionii CBS 160.54 TaxID=1279043 RepID=V9DPC8_9EURO|nr:uncharacterized protein G647_00955 [Cladophialophora carrionii CBS 160.54]ETI28506.1 hypothetical protein G647_00955 [Cladophialophora carrionii CBS 160.54]